MRAHMMTHTTRLMLGTRAMIALLVLVFAASAAHAGEAKKAGSKKSVKAVAGQKTKSSGSQHLSRDIVFDGSSVNGRYHSAGEAVAIVEQEKSLNNLIGWRKNFKDRLAAERQRLAQDASVSTRAEGQ